MRALILLLACVGCDGSTFGSDTADAPMTYDEFVDAYAEALCEWYLECSPEEAELNDRGTMETCTTDTRIRALAQWEADCYGYDIEAAEACLGAWLAADECGVDYEDEIACAAVCS